MQAHKQEAAFKKMYLGTSLAVQWLPLHSTVGGMGSVPGRGARSHGLRHGQNDSKK